MPNASIHLLNKAFHAQMTSQVDVAISWEWNNKTYRNQGLCDVENSQKGNSLRNN